MSSENHYFTQADRTHRYLVDHYAVSTCLNCCTFDKEADICKAAGQKPPTEVLVFGCPMWDSIPF